MDSKQRAALRAAASKEDTIAQVGKEGLSENLLKSLDTALSARELIKISVLKNCEDDVMGIASGIAASTKSEIVTVIGNKLVLYRRSTKQGVKHVLIGEISDEPKKKRISKPNQTKKTNFKGEHFQKDEQYFAAPAPTYGARTDQRGDGAGKVPTAARHRFGNRKK